jgi:predicted nucleotidyltransferase
VSKNIQSLLNELKSAQSHIYVKNLSGIYLYGSYARNEEKAESDLDVAIVLKDFEDYWQEIQRTSQVISELSLKYSVTISPVRIRRAHWVAEDTPFLNNLRKESIAL